jgi:hypothetical protein
MTSPRRFPPPWSIEEGQGSFIVTDTNGQALAYLYFEDEPQRQMSMKRLSRDEAFLIAVNIAKLPSVPRQDPATGHVRRRLLSAEHAAARMNGAALPRACG